jgi:phosphatidylinositol glycan class O
MRAANVNVVGGNTSATSVHRRSRSLLVDAIAIILSLAGLYGFAHSFFLAKRSLPQTSDCDESVTLLQDVLGLTRADTTLLEQRGLLSGTTSTRNGCWMDRKVDSMAIIVVDALRFDFALYNLPESIGRRLPTSSSSANPSPSNTTRSRLFQFVADPPTVTMQRLKALTTGGLPTFADISANFGGASIEEDSWVHQLLGPNNNPSSSSNTGYNNNRDNWKARGLSKPTTAGFVGDDTWEDLFPNLFQESHPLPSFNTRDLDTVDNGCLLQIPRLLHRLRGLDQSASSSTEEQQQQKEQDDLEVMVVHFLGVDHVGHTYGPHNEHMDAKLRQMDAALSTLLEFLDESHDTCHTALIFGDHGMTPDGNHGGGTQEEINAALFVHYSPGCGTLSLDDTTNHLPGDRETSYDYVEAAFASIHQIDLVPTIALLLGLPIPFANLGSLVPSLLPEADPAKLATSLALNAAQVWRYFTMYSATANKLPNLHVLHERLRLATAAFQEALAVGQGDPEHPPTVDADKYYQAAGLFKAFLLEALDLGQRVWTRFDSIGMTLGVTVLLGGLILYSLPLFRNQEDGGGRGVVVERLPQAQHWEVVTALVFIVFQSGVLSFSNSYILEEEYIIMYALAVLSLVVVVRLRSDPVPSALWWAVGLLPVASRLSELLVSGHGLDPSVRLYLVHNAAVFVSSLALLLAFRWFLFQQRFTLSLLHAAADCTTLVFIAGSWWEKRDLDPERNGFLMCQIALVFLFTGVPLSMYQALSRPSEPPKEDKHVGNRQVESDILTILCKVLIAIMLVTGPSAASSLVLYTLQASIMYTLSRMSGSLKVHPIVLAAMWRLVTRHVFFATNHGCAFNRLQYSAAFVATKEFYFVTGGISLFLNTFGWEVVGLAFAWLLSQHQGRSKVWRLYGSFQLIEALASCISVSLLRRHLMVWDIYAPHFLFVAIFTALSGLCRLTVFLLTRL